jgi:hypothetical protein
MSISPFSFARFPTPDDMMSLAGGLAAAVIVSTGCATMISSEYPGGDLLSIVISTSC